MFIVYTGLYYYIIGPFFDDTCRAIHSSSYPSMIPHAGSSGSRGIVALRYMSDESTSRPFFDPSAPPGHAILAVTGR